MLLGLNVFGNSIPNNTLPSKQASSEVSFYGDYVLDALVINDSEKEDNVILGKFYNEIIPSYGTDTVLVGNFEDTLECGSLITTLSKELTKFVIRRRVVGENLNPIIAELPYSEDLNTYIDYYPKNNVNYVYTVSPYYEDEFDKIEGRGIEGSGFVDFFGWTLTSLDDEPVVYKFDLMVKSDNIDVVTDFKLYENYTKYPAFRFGNMEYRASKLSTVPYTYNESTFSYYINLSTLNTIKNFINNKKEKILRNSIGESIKVVTHKFDYKFFDDTPDQIYEISFEFTETGEV